MSFRLQGQFKPWVQYNQWWRKHVGSHHIGSALSGPFSFASGLYADDPTGIVMGQILNLQRRIALIKFMRIFGVSSLLLCVAGGVVHVVEVPEPAAF
jgi:hypothetical protein